MTPRTYTDPSVLQGIADGAPWADPIMDPAEIDWTVRQAIAAIPFEVVDGRPVNPCEDTDVWYGRNEMGHWGEALAADARVSIQVHGRPYILMIERDDGHGWAFPGGHVDLGETAIDAAIRELSEETGLKVSAAAPWSIGQPRYVPDPRASREAWMVTVLCSVDFGSLADFPAATGGDDAARAAWIPARNYDEMVTWLAKVYRGRVFPAHVDMLKEALG